jgi:hypothetical protein
MAFCSASILSSCDSKPEGKFTRMASSEYKLLAKRMDAVTECESLPEWKNTLKPKLANSELRHASTALIRCMSGKGYSLILNAKGHFHPATSSDKALWANSVNFDCYRRSFSSLKALEDAEARPLSLNDPAPSHKAP